MAARAGFGSLLLQLPEVAGPCAERCSMLRPVCNLLAKRLYLWRGWGWVRRWNQNMKKQNNDDFYIDLVQDM